MKHQISQEDVLRCTDSEQMRNVAFEIATRANNHLKKVTERSLVQSSCEVLTTP